VECSGWYAFLERGPAVLATTVLYLARLLRGDDMRVQQAALQALARLACTFGPEHITREMSAAGKGAAGLAPALPPLALPARAAAEGARTAP
jgi:hypothetical protein